MLTTTFRNVVAMLALGLCAVPLACGGRSLSIDDRTPAGDATVEGGPAENDGSQTGPGIAGDGGMDDIALPEETSPLPGAEPDAEAEAEVEAASHADAAVEADAASDSDAEVEAGA